MQIAAQQSNEVLIACGYRRAAPYCYRKLAILVWAASEDDDIVDRTPRACLEGDTYHRLIVAEAPKRIAEEEGSEAGCSKGMLKSDPPASSSIGTRNGLVQGLTVLSQSAAGPLDQ